MLETEVATGHSFERIVQDFGDQLGSEARAILRALIAERDHEDGEDIEDEEEI